MPCSHLATPSGVSSPPPDLILHFLQPAHTLDPGSLFLHGTCHHLAYIFDWELPFIGFFFPSPLGYKFQEASKFVFSTAEFPESKSVTVYKTGVQ